MTEEEVRELQGALLRNIVQTHLMRGIKVKEAMLGVYEQLITQMERQGGNLGLEFGRGLREIVADLRKEVRPPPSEDNYPQQPPRPPIEPSSPNYPYSPNYPGFEQRQRQIYSARDRMQPPRQAQPSTPALPRRTREGRPPNFANRLYGRFSR